VYFDPPNLVELKRCQKGLRVLSPLCATEVSQQPENLVMLEQLAEVMLEAQVWHLWHLAIVAAKAWLVICLPLHRFHEKQQELLALRGVALERLERPLVSLQ